VGKSSTIFRGQLLPSLKIKRENGGSGCLTYLARVHQKFPQNAELDTWTNDNLLWKGPKQPNTTVGYNLLYLISLQGHNSIINEVQTIWKLKCSIFEGTSVHIRKIILKEAGTLLTPGVLHFTFLMFY
jgi:hypothetical protein